LVPTAAAPGAIGQEAVAAAASWFTDGGAESNTVEISARVGAISEEIQARWLVTTDAVAMAAAVLVPTAAAPGAIGQEAVAPSKPADNTHWNRDWTSAKCQCMNVTNISFFATEADCMATECPKDVAAASWPSDGGTEIITDIEFPARVGAISEDVLDETAMQGTTAGKLLLLALCVVPLLFLPELVGTATTNLKGKMTWALLMAVVFGVACWLETMLASDAIVCPVFTKAVLATYAIALAILGFGPAAAGRARGGLLAVAVLGVACELVESQLLSLSFIQQLVIGLLGMCAGYVVAAVCIDTWRREAWAPPLTAVALWVWLGGWGPN
jgi:hypothetical protein